MIRMMKGFMVGSIALFFSLVALNNIVDYPSNEQFVHHVMSMDTTFKHPSLMSRAVTQASLQNLNYKLLIAWEITVAAICWVATLLLLKNCKNYQVGYRFAKKVGSLGLGLGFLLYMLGFIDIGGEWFAMWQSSHWNGQSAAGLFASLCLLVLIFLNQAEEN